jgi:methionine synthase I (cobalamin-dependent)
MPKINLRERIRQGVFLLDGAMGTELFARGIEAGVCNDYLNIESPDIISDIHQSYLSAGSDAVITNTFGANKYALARHGFADKVAEINTAGAKIAHKAAGKDKYVLGDIGPSGDFLEPLGNIKFAELKDAFKQQVKALLEGDIDGFIIESMTALDEIAIAIEAVKSVGGGLPVFASMSFGKGSDDFRTMMGVDVDSFVTNAISLGIDAIGFNCGTATLDDYIELAKKYVSVTQAPEKEQVTIFAEPNAGKPELIDGRAVYKVLPEDFAAAAEKIHSLGINIIGGCCGTGPAHIAAVSKKLRVTNR